ncbi:MAG: recombination mediator RecR [Crocinitomicaceae bacterium]|nr:recombination mediator RecR [Crocinitomicaceae bacterium]
MKIPSKHIEEAVEQLSSLPGIGKRTALRLVLQMLNRSEEEIQQFSEAFVRMKKEVKKCTSCGNISDLDVCEICSNSNRDHGLICVVEDIRDIMALESTGYYKGIYHVLGGVISPMDGIGPKDLNIGTLLDKARDQNLSEVIFALSATMEGDTTNFYLFKKLSPFNLKITCLSRGVAVGTELQYADELTLGRSIINRQPFQLNA